MVYFLNRIAYLLFANFAWVFLGIFLYSQEGSPSTTQIEAMQSIFKNRLSQTKSRLDQLEERLNLGVAESTPQAKPTSPVTEKKLYRSSLDFDRNRARSSYRSEFDLSEEDPISEFRFSKRESFLPSWFGKPIPSRPEPPTISSRESRLERISSLSRQKTQPRKTRSSFGKPFFDPSAKPSAKQIPASDSSRPRSSPTSQSTPSSDEPIYPVSRIVLSYGGDLQGLPNLDPLSSIRFQGDGAGAPYIDLGLLLSDFPLESPIRLRSRDLRQISEIIVQFLKSEGFEGIVALVDPSQIDPTSGKDLRSEKDFLLTYNIWVARINEVTLSYAPSDKSETPDRIQRMEALTSDLMNHHNVLGQPFTTSFKRSVSRLGRSPARNTRLLLTPSTRPGEVEAVVEIKEDKNLAITAGASNSGSPTTGEWLFRGNLLAHQLTHREDPADFSWMISDTGQRLGLGGGYVIPLVQPGVLDLSLRTAYKEYDGTSFAVTQIDFEGTSWIADLALMGAPLDWESADSSLTYEVGLGFEKVESYNSILFDASANFLTLRLGLTHEQSTGIARSLSSVVLSSNLSSQRRG